MSGKKYSFYFGSGAPVPTQEEQLLTQQNLDKSDLLSKSDPYNIEAPNSEKVLKSKLEIEVVQPTEKDIYKKFDDIIKNKKFDSLSQVSDTNIYGLEVTTNEFQILYNYNPFTISEYIPNDIDLRKLYHLDTDILKNITVSNFLTKKYLISVTHYNNNFFQTLFKDDIACIDCCYCPNNSNNLTQKGGRTNIVDLNASLQEFINRVRIDNAESFNNDNDIIVPFRGNTYKKYNEIDFTDILKIITIMSYTQTTDVISSHLYNENDTAKKGQITSYLNDKSKLKNYNYLINHLLYSNNNDNSPEFVFKSHEWNDSVTPNKKNYLMATGPDATNMVGYEALYAFLPNSTSVNDYIKKPTYDDLSNVFAPSIRSREHILKAYLLNIILFTLAEGSESDNYKALDYFLTQILKGEFEGLVEYLQFTSKIDNMCIETYYNYCIEDFVETHLDRSKIPMYLIANLITTKTDLNYILPINTNLRTTKQFPLDLSKYLNIERLNKILNMLFFCIFYGHLFETELEFQEETYDRFIKYSNKNLFTFGEPLHEEEENMYGYNYDSKDLDLNEMLFYNRKTLGSPVYFNPVTPGDSTDAIKLRNINRLEGSGDIIVGKLPLIQYEGDIPTLNNSCYGDATTLYFKQSRVKNKIHAILSLLSDLVYSSTNHVKNVTTYLKNVMIQSQGIEQAVPKVSDPYKNYLLHYLGGFGEDPDYPYGYNEDADEQLPKAIQHRVHAWIYYDSNIKKEIHPITRTTSKTVNSMLEEITQEEKQTIIDIIKNYQNKMLELEIQDANETNEELINQLREYTDKTINYFESKPFSIEHIQRYDDTIKYYLKNQIRLTKNQEKIGKKIQEILVIYEIEKDKTYSEVERNKERAELDIDSENEIFLFIAVRGSKTKGDWDNTDVFISSGEASNVYSIFEMHSILDEIRTTLFNHITELNKLLNLGNPVNNIQIFTTGHSLGGFFATAMANLSMGSNSFHNKINSSLNTTCNQIVIPCVFNPFYKDDSKIFEMINSLPKIYIHRIRNFNIKVRSAKTFSLAHPQPFEDLASCYYGDYFEINRSVLKNVFLYEYSNCCMRGVDFDSFTTLGYYDPHYIDLVRGLVRDGGDGHAMINFNGLYLEFLNYKVLNLAAQPGTTYEKFKYIKNKDGKKISFKFFQPFPFFNNNSTRFTSNVTRNTVDERSPNITQYHLIYYKMYGTKNGLFIYNRPEFSTSLPDDLDVFINDYLNKLLYIENNILPIDNSINPDENCSQNLYNVSYTESMIRTADTIISLGTAFGTRVGSLLDGDPVGDAALYGGKRKKTIKKHFKKNCKKTRRKK